MQLTADHDWIFPGFSTFPDNSLTLELFFRFQDFPDFPDQYEPCIRKIFFSHNICPIFLYEMIPVGAK